MFKYKKNNNILSKSKIWIIIILVHIFLLLNFQKNDGKDKSNLLIGLCAIGKNENLYAEEFVKHYKKLGYDHIFIYDNNNINDERFQKVLLNYISDDFVTIIDYRGFRGKNNHPQFDAYFDCYQKNYKNYDWLSFFDFDEFLELRNNKSIKEFLSKKEFNKCKNIKINWVVYSDNDLVYYDNRSVEERFTKPLLESKMNYHIKSTVRGHLKKNFWNKIYHPHSSNVRFTACSSTGKILKDYSSPFQIPPNYENAYLKHYSTKSIEEYIHKIKRGRADLYYKLDNKMWNFALNHFFEINKKTKAKINYIKKALNTPLRSIQNQSLKDIEIIIVDDGSSENKINEVFNQMEKDNRIIFLKHKINKGILISRIDGIRYAFGEYILNIDQDDLYFDNHVFENIYYKAKKLNVDILQFSSIYFINKYRKNKSYNKLPKRVTITQPYLKVFI